MGNITDRILSLPAWIAIGLVFLLPALEAEACSCKVMCSCIFLAPATEDHRDVFIGWHATDGRMGNVDLKGLNAALVVHSPKQMTDGGWKLALYTDERASKEGKRFDDDGHALGRQC